MFNFLNVAFVVWDPLVTFLWFLDFLYLTGRWAISSGAGLLSGMTWTSGWRRWSSLWSWLISFRQMKNTIRMKSTKTETAIYRLLRLGVSMKGEEETTRILGQCTGALPRCVQNADWTSPRSRTDSRNKCFLDLALGLQGLQVFELWGFTRSTIIGAIQWTRRTPRWSREWYPGSPSRGTVSTGWWRTLPSSTWDQCYGTSIV